jgi:hypothetical protein
VICGQHQSVDDPDLIDREDLRSPDERSDKNAELDQTLIVEALDAIGVDIDLEEGV